MYEIRHYLTEEVKDIYVNWLKALRDSVAKIQIVRRVNRLEQENFGDHKFCRDGVWELRIDTGAGYRIYYAMPCHGRAGPGRGPHCFCAVE